MFNVFSPVRYHNITGKLATATQAYNPAYGNTHMSHSKYTTNIIFYIYYAVDTLR